VANIPKNIKGGDMFFGALVPNDNKGSRKECIILVLGDPPFCHAEVWAYRTEAHFSQTIVDPENVCIPDRVLGECSYRLDFSDPVQRGAAPEKPLDPVLPPREKPLYSLWLVIERGHEPFKKRLSNVFISKQSLLQEISADYEDNALDDYDIYRLDVSGDDNYDLNWVNVDALGGINA